MLLFYLEEVPFQLLKLQKGGYKTKSQCVPDVLVCGFVQHEPPWKRPTCVREEAAPTKKSSNSITSADCFHFPGRLQVDNEVYGSLKYRVQCNRK